MGRSTGILGATTASDRLPGTVTGLAAIIERRQSELS